MAMSGKLPPIPFAKSAIGGVNKDLIVTLTGFDPNGDVLIFLITSPPTNDMLYQFDVISGRGNPITSSGTPVTDPSRVVFAPAADAFGAPYTTFAFLASDAA